MMENRGKRVKIVGKGHAFCFERELFNWYRRESFVDVFLTCIGSPDDYIKDGRSLRRIPANRSVLAAASPVFASLFCDNPLVEEDVQITLVGYSYSSFRAIVEYIYTGSLLYPCCDKEHVEKILCDFRIPVPTVESDHHTRSQSRFPTIDITTSEPILEKNHDLNIKIVSSVSLSSEVQKSIASSQISHSKKPRLVEGIHTRKKPTTQVISSGSQIQEKTNVHVISDEHCNGSQKSAFSNRKENNRNLNLLVFTSGKESPRSSEPITRSKPTPTIENSMIRILNRNIEATNFRENRLTIVPPLLPINQLGPCKSFAEKTVLNSAGNCFLPPINVDVRASSNGHYTNVNDDTAKLNNYRNIVSALYDVPGTYTLYRERCVFPLDPPFYEPSETTIINHLYVPSFVDKKPIRTYQEKPTTRGKSRRLQSSLSLTGIRIDSVHQVKGKVHIRTMGELLVNKESESLFEDYPLSYLSPDQLIALLSREHNYSFGEMPGPVESECFNRKELASDLEDYKRAIQLVISEQRRKNRLKHRMQSYIEEILTLKRRAGHLLGICHEMKNQAHEIDPEFFRRFKKQVPSERNDPPSISKPFEPKVPCSVCNKLVKKNWLKRHMIILHSEERNHLCDECGRTFVLKDQLRAHQLRQHKAIPGNHICDQCGRSFRFARYLNRHMSLHSSEKPHICRYCDKAFRLKPVLIKHVRTHTGEKPYKCTVCGRCFRQRTTYARHLKMHEKRQDAGVVESSGLGLPRLKCDFCSMTFKLDLFLMLHRAKHTGETPALPCPTCPLTYPSIKELTLHRKSQHLDSVYSCQLCPKVFMNKANFDFHVYKHSNPEAVKKKYPKLSAVDSNPCACDFCDKLFKSRSALDYHIKGIHLGEKPLKCQYCDKTFSHKPSMEQHMRTHTGERPYKCDQCPSAFKQQQHLTAHMVVHTGERPFSCEHCNKTFPHKTTLYAHLRIHTGKRLVCAHCRKVMPSLAQLVRHEELCSFNTNESISSIE